MARSKVPTPVIPADDAAANASDISHAPLSTVDQVVAQAPAVEAEKEVTTREEVCGVNVMTGKTVMRTVEVKKPRREYKEGRKEYTVKKDMYGSVQFRPIQAKAGEKVWLNEDEYNVFKAYL